jgi:hypothetical protein
VTYSVVYRAVYAPPLASILVTKTVRERKGNLMTRTQAARKAAALAFGLLMGASSLVAASAASAAEPAAGQAVEPLRGWNAKSTAGDKAGAHAQGNISRLSNGRVKMTGTLKDTKGDGKAACLWTQAHYRDGGRRNEYDYVGGKGRSIKLGSQDYYSFAPSVTGVWVREGLGKSGKCNQGWAGGWYRIW